MHISASKSLHQEDLCMRACCAYLCVGVSASGPCMTTSAKSPYADLVCRTAFSGCLHQDPVGPLVQDLCLRISCPTSAPRSCKTTGARFYGIYRYEKNGMLKRFYVFLFGC